MIPIFERKQIANGVFFNKITDPRFKMNRVSVQFFTDFNELPRADCALASYALAECSAEYPDYSKLSAALLDLYDASITSAVICRFDKRCVEFNASALDDRYALAGEKLEDGLMKLLCGCIFRPKAKNGAFDEKLTEMMRAELIDAIDSVINDKAQYASRNAAKTAYIGEPMELPATGTREDAEKVTARSAYEAYRKMLETARVEISASGCSDFAGTEKIFTEEFSNIPRRCACELYCSPSPLKEKPARVSDSLEMKQAILRMYFKASDVIDRPANMLFSKILGGMTTSRFFLNIREKQSLCYYCYCFSDRLKRTLTCYAGIEPSDKKRAEEAILAELRDICENGVTEEELSFAKLDTLSQLSAVYDSAGGIMNWYIGQLNDERFLTPEEYADLIRGVTAERVQAAAQLYSLDTVYVLSGSGT